MKIHLTYLDSVNPFPHTANLQQTTLKMSWQNCEKALHDSIIIDLSWKHFGKRRNYSFLAISPFVTVFSKVVCCSGVRKRLYVGKGEDITDVQVEPTLLRNVILYLLHWLDCPFVFRVCVILEDMRGQPTEAISFKTSPCEPDQPAPPTLVQKSKTSLTLKWKVSIIICTF